MAKGSAFEGLVFAAIRRCLGNPGLGVDPKNCRVFRGKRYFSVDRNNYIVTDVSIEMFVADSEHPAILWIWECKDYARPIPVDDVEEFHAKLQQLGADCTKGTIIARGPFQRSAIAFARSKGIGLARLEPRRIRHMLFDRRTDAPNRGEVEERLMAESTGFHQAMSGTHVDFDGVAVYSVASSGWSGCGKGIETYIREELRTV